MTNVWTIKKENHSYVFKLPITINLNGFERYMILLNTVDVVNSVKCSIFLIKRWIYCLAIMPETKTKVSEQITGRWKEKQDFNSITYYYSNTRIFTLNICFAIFSYQSSKENIALKSN